MAISDAPPPAVSDASLRGLATPVFPLNRSPQRVVADTPAAHAGSAYSALTAPRSVRTQQCAVVRRMASFAIAPESDQVWFVAYVPRQVVSCMFLDTSAGASLLRVPSGYRRLRTCTGRRSAVVPCSRPAEHPSAPSVYPCY